MSCLSQTWTQVTGLNMIQNNDLLDIFYCNTISSTYERRKIEQGLSLLRCCNFIFQQLTSPFSVCFHFWKKVSWELKLKSSAKIYSFICTGKSTIIARTKSVYQLPSTLQGCSNILAKIYVLRQVKIEITISQSQHKA